MSEEKRLYQRVKGAATVFIELMGPSVDAPDRAPIIICDSLDVSRAGIRLCVDTFIEPGTILHLGLQPAGHEQPLYVVAEVRWAKRTDAGSDYTIGFELLESDGTDLERWQSLLEGLTDTG
jgi:hypothetical protein